MPIYNGYPIAWGSVCLVNIGFTRVRRSCLCPIRKIVHRTKWYQYMAHWLKMKPEEKKLYTKPQPQKWCTQEVRQEAYDNWETTV